MAQKMPLGGAKDEHFSCFERPCHTGLSNYYVKSNTKCPTAEVLESCNEHITAHLNFAITYLELNGGENSY